MVATVARACQVEASALAARSRLWLIAASPSQAALASKRPEGRCASGPFFSSAMVVSMIAWPRCQASASSSGIGLFVKIAW
jgi:hypothetical protein